MVSHLSTIPQGPVKERVSAARGTRQRLASILQDSQRTRGFHRPSSRCNSTIDLASLDAQSNALYGNDQRHSGSYGTYGTYGTYGYDSEVAFHSQEPPDLFLDDCTPDIANDLPPAIMGEANHESDHLASPSHPKGPPLPPRSLHVLSHSASPLRNSSSSFRHSTSSCVDEPFHSPLPLDGVRESSMTVHNRTPLLRRLSQQSSLLHATSTSSRRSDQGDHASDPPSPYVSASPHVLVGRGVVSGPLQNRMHRVSNGAVDASEEASKSHYVKKLSRSRSSLLSALNRSVSTSSQDSFPQELLEEGHRTPSPGEENYNPCRIISSPVLDGTRVHSPSHEESQKRLSPESEWVNSPVDIAENRTTARWRKLLTSSTIWTLLRSRL